MKTLYERMGITTLDTLVPTDVGAVEISTDDIEQINSIETAFSEYCAKNGIVTDESTPSAFSDFDACVELINNYVQGVITESPKDDIPPYVYFWLDNE